MNGRRLALAIALVFVVASCDLQVEQDTAPFIDALPEVTPDATSSVAPTPGPEARPPITPSTEPAVTDSATTAEPSSPRPTAVATSQPTFPTTGPTSTPNTQPATEPSPTPSPTPSPSPTVDRNTAPIAQDDVGSSMSGGVIFIDAIANDHDPDGDAISYVSAGTPEHGFARLENGQIRYEPQPGFAGTDAWTYQITDGQASATGTITVEVTAANRPPVARDDFVLVQSGGTAQVDVTANDSDPEGEALRVQIVSGPSNGSASVVGDTDISYTNSSRTSASSDSVTYRVIDQHGNQSATATLNISINHAPRALSDTVQAGWDPVTFNVISGAGTTTKGQDTDPDGDTISLTGVGDPGRANGPLSCSADGNCTWDPTNTCGSIDVSVTYSIADGRGGTASANLRLQMSIIC